MTDRRRHEARLEDAGSGLAPVDDGWFVVNVRAAEWWIVRGGGSGSMCFFEGQTVEFPQLGINVSVLEPGESNGLYHAESGQEAFLVLSGECRLLVEGEERLLGPWDFFHCPPMTEDIFVGAGKGPCAILMAGARSANDQVRYPVSQLAARYGASAAEELHDWRLAYAGCEPSRRERPAYWHRLPWA